MRQYRKTAFLFLAPFLTVFVAFYLTPVFYAIYLSLFIRKRVGIGPAKEVFGGLANYIRAVQDGDFLNGLKNMFVFGVVQVPVMLGLAIILALLLAESRGVFMKICRTSFFMPYGIPSAIGALIWGYLYSPNLSPFNQVLAAFHAGSIDFLSPNVVLYSIANIVTWTWTGYNMITLFAALQNIPTELYEAARVDGATPWDIVRSIKIPLLMPTMKLLFIFSVIGTSQLFTEAFVLRPLGYVADNITPNLYLYLTAARDANYSYAGALAILLALLIFVISGPFLRRISSK
ncbi:MAG: multiple sugar transport system permease protein [Verrucomicrobiota bacterium]|jgi:multiple sugar transport system permease protein|nr:multiple sugar transport system permease protein [Verrucomicrobiota bacterium]MEA3163359.1 multiple sugar transport system permease protein [Verrucomicrobiota bacterium]